MGEMGEDFHGLEEEEMELEGSRSPGGAHLLFDPLEARDLMDERMPAAFWPKWYLLSLVGKLFPW